MSTPTLLRRLVDQGRIDEIPAAQRQILRRANEDALLDLSIAVMRAEGSEPLVESRLASRSGMN